MPVLTREEIARRLAGTGYVADRDLATALLLMDMLNRPLLLEGAAGVGKTAIAYALATQFALGMMRVAEKAEAFLVHTRLAEVGAAMRDRDRLRALDRLTLLSKGVGGGTRLGESLATFNRNHAQRALAGRSVCFIASDGCETGDAGLLSREMAALRRHCRRIVWLNPAAEGAGYEPIAQGM